MSAITLDSPIEEINMNNFTSSYKVNTYAPLKLITELKPEIAVNISSTDGIDTYNEYNIIYSLTKSSLIKLTEILSKYLKETKIYALCPNFINTSIVQNMNPIFLESELKRIKQKELIDPHNVSLKIKELLKGKEKSGSIFRMDGNNEYRKVN